MELPRRRNKPGPLLAYISEYHAADPAKAKILVQSIRIAMGTNEGAILLDLIEKSTMLCASDPEENKRALGAKNAQSFIAHDLRRIMSNELDALLEDEKSPRVGPGRRPKRFRSSDS